MNAFEQSWLMMKADEYLYYNVHLTPRNDEESNRLYQLELQLAKEGITFDSGGGLNGRDIHLDFSLRGATPNQVLQRIADIGVPYEIEMVAGDTPYHGTEERFDYDRKERQALDERLTLETGQTHIDGQPYTEPEVIGHHPCPNCGDGEIAVLIREGIQHDNKVSLNCPECGYMDMDWGDENDRL